jgi:hypothetical protein
MPQERLKELLGQLHQELENTPAADAETRRMAKKLDEDIHRMLEQEQEQDSVTDRAKALEAHFAAEYPVAERFLREIIDTLAKLGI